MNWKKLIKYFFILLLLALVVLAFLANRNMKQIYGGLTEVVDHRNISLPNNDVCINNVSILSPDGTWFIPNQHVCVENGVITSVDSVPPSFTEATVINGAGKFLIPGLIDSHVHLFKSPNDLLLYVANGVTAIRELIGEDNHLKWREEIGKGRIGPDMYIASPRLGSFGAIEGWFMEWTLGFDIFRNSEEAGQRVKEYAKQGYDAVKIYSYLNRESYEAVNKLAAAEGLDVVGHVPWELELSDIWDSRQSDISHLEEIMNAFRREFGKIENQQRAEDFLKYVARRSREIAPELKENDISVTTTLWLTQSFVRQKFELESVLKEVALAYENPGISEWDDMIPEGLGWLPGVNRYQLPNDLDGEELAWQEMFWTTYSRACEMILKILSGEGVSILAGTDANLPPAVPGFSLHDELLAMTDAGMPASQVLQSATKIPAERMGHNSGSIAEGKNANLVLLEGNPLENIANTRKINTVFLHGRIMDRDLLNRLLKEVKMANDASRKKEIVQFLN